MAVALCSAPALADTVLVGTGGSNATDTGLVKSYTVTSSGTVWTANSAFNTDAIGAPQVMGLGQDIYGNVYVSGSNGIFMYRQTGGANIGRLTATMGSGNLTGNGFEGLTIGADGKLLGAIPFGTGNNKIVSFDTTTLVSGSVQTAQAGTQLSISGSLNTPRGMTVASDGNVYIANRGAGNVLRWNGSTTGTAFSFSTAQGIAWDAANNRFLVSANNLSGVAGAGVGTATLSGSTSPNAISSGSNNWIAVMPIEGTVASVSFGNGSAAALSGTIFVGGTSVVSSLGNPQALLNVRDTRIWSGGNGSWSTAGSWTQGLGGGSGTATFTSGTGAESLPSILTFTGTAGGTATNDVSGSVFVGGINFAPGAGAYTLTGSAFTLGANANIRNLTTTGTQTIASNVAVAGSQWIYADTGATLAMTGAVSGSGTVLTKVGPGVLRLSGSNSYTGGTTISAGTLNVGNQFALGSTAAALSVNGGTLNLGGNSVWVTGLTGASGATITTSNVTGTAQLTNAGGGTYAGTITDNGVGVVSVIKRGGGGSASAWSLSGSTANTYTGTTTVLGLISNLSILSLSKTSGNAIGGDLLVSSGGLVWWGNTTNGDMIPNTASLTIDGGFVNLTDTLSGQQTTGITETMANLTLLSGTMWTGAGSNWTITGTGSLAGGSLGQVSSGTISFGTLRLSSNQAMSGNLAGTTMRVGSGGFAIIGSSTFTMSASFPSGARIVLDGPLSTEGTGTSAIVSNITSGSGSVALQLSGTAGNITRTFTVSSTAQLAVGVPITNGSATTAGITKAGAGTLTLSASNSYSGATTINAGTLLVNDANALAGSGSVTFGGGVLRYSSNNAVDYAAKIVGSGSAIAIDTNGRSVTFGSALASTNTGGLTKSGSGSLSLNAANLYSGVTTISAGTLALGGSGSFDSSPTITIGDAGSSGAVLDLTAKSGGFTFLSNQTVKGIGTIQLASGKTLTINGTLAAGNSPGTLTVAGGDLVLGGSSITSYEISGTNNTVGSGINDLTTVSGSLTLGGTLNVIPSPAFDLFGNRTYRVFNYATSGTGSLAGSMTIGTTPDANYLYSLNTATSGQVNLFVQRRADQAATFTMTTGTVTRALVNTAVSLTGSVSNLSPEGSASLTLGLSSTGQLSVTGFTTGSLAGLSGTAVAGTINTGNTAGTRTWTVVNTDTSAITTTSTATGSVTVVNQRSFTVDSGTIALGTFLRTLGTSATTTISSSGSYVTTASATLDGFTGTNTAGFGLSLATGTNVFDGGSALQQAVYSISGSATSAGVINGSFSSSVTAELGSIGPVGVLLTGTALDPALASFTAGSPTTTWLIDFGSLTQGSGTQSLGFNLFNLNQMPGYTADLALLSIISGTGNTATIGTNLVQFNNLTAGTSSPWLASISTANVGSFTNTYTLSFKSANNGTVFSGDTQQSLNLTVTGIIVVPEPGACALAAIGIAAVTWRLSRRRCRHSS